MSITIQATGRRKTSTARVFLSSGSGKVTINNKLLADYFSVQDDQHCLLSPLRVTSLEKAYNLFITVKGGGVTGQVEAIRHGITRALLKSAPACRAELKSNGFITRDPRKVERKKPGQRKARKSAPFVKR